MMNIEGMQFDSDAEDSDNTEVAGLEIGGEADQYFSFYICGKIFAISILGIREIFSLISNTYISFFGLRLILSLLRQMFAGLSTIISLFS